MQVLDMSLSQVLVSSLLIVIAVGVPCTIIVALVQRYHSSISGIPGPISASIGTFWQCWHTARGDYPIAVSDAHRKHGSLVRISYNEVSVGDSEGLKILNSTMDKGPLYSCFAIPNDTYQNTMSERKYKQCMRMRQNAAAGYSLSNLLKGEEYLDKLIASMEQRIETEGSGGTKAVSLGKWIHFLTMDIVGEVTFSAPFGFLREGRDIGNSIWNTSRLAFYISFMASCQWLHKLLLGSPILRLVDCEKIPFVHVWTTVLNGVSRRKASLGARYDMMEHWMAQRQKDPERMPEAELLTAALANLGAGGDTIGSAIQAFFYYLLKNNSYYIGKLRQELASAGHVPGASTPVSFASSQTLPFLQACIKETLRLFSPIPWTLPRVVPPQGMRINGHFFPAGTIVSVSPYVLHHNEAIWGADADEFKPERWLAEPAVTRGMEKHFIPFGAGYNSCLGHNLAAMELGKVTATLLRDFDFRLERPEREWRVHWKFVQNPSGWPVFVTRRKQG